MTVPVDPPCPFAPLFDAERRRLLDLLASLGDDDWRRPTPCPEWDVLGLTLHLVGTDLSFVAHHRDGYLGTPAPDGLDEAGFIAWLDALQVEWVHAARRLSPRLAAELLAWLGSKVVQAIDTADPTAIDARVSWASDDRVPRWLDHGRELTERWIHRQQLLDAVGRPNDLRADLAEPVLDVLRWAYPYRLGAHVRPDGSSVEVVVTDGAPRRWTIVCRSGRWAFEPSGTPPIASLAMTTAQAWRLLSNNHRRDVDGAVTADGDDDLVATLTRARAIIGTLR